MRRRSTVKRRKANDLLILTAEKAGAYRIEIVGVTHVDVVLKAGDTIYVTVEPGD